MGKQRVVITGLGAISPYGEGCPALLNGLYGSLCALRPVDASDVAGLVYAAGGKVPHIDQKRINRELRRTMSPMSIYASLAAWQALEQAGIDRAQPNKPRIGIAIGSTLGSSQALYDFFAEYIATGSVDGVRSTAFFKVMGHSVASNVAMACGASGRLLAPSAACSSGLCGIGLAYESIQQGKETMMLCGGADEFHILTAATFDRMNAASHEQDPLRASLPFDVKRSGIAISEGAGVLFLESLESALSRQATILAEITGYASNTSPHSIVHPDTDSMRQCMQSALEEAQLGTKDIDYVNSHATATLAGDSAEGQAIEKLFGAYTVPVSSLKGHIGHTLGASGALESIACIAMMQKNCLLPTLHLTEPDKACGKLDHVQKLRPQPLRHCVKNSFAMGGIYCSLVLSRYQEQ